MKEDSRILEGVPPELIMDKKIAPDPRHIEDCDISIGEAIRVLSGKWKLSLLHELGGQTRRFNELRRALPDISQKMLTQQLRELEEEGLVKRNVIPDNPPKVEYSLSAYGQTLRPLFAVMLDWGANHRSRKAQSEKLSGKSS
ncbi:winged helix-turn-helix transcriptional regulator [Paenibacillus terreus]|uniref:Winged helix-turn-helix transcriptional regulator n=1 Tax=Paenibacillus terreus TaxID=1387834 RepID=A0ABV5B9D9_9BACL